MTRKKNVTAYTFEFRENAVRLSKIPSRTVASVAQELKIPAWKLRLWVKESKQKLERSSDMDDLVRLTNENKRLKEEIEILKKAAAYFAKSLQ